jgi:hypothetical protein
MMMKKDVVDDDVCAGAVCFVFVILSSIEWKFILENYATSKIFIHYNNYLIDSIFLN